MKNPALFISDNLLSATALAFVTGIALSPLIGGVSLPASVGTIALFCSLLLLVVLNLRQQRGTRLSLFLPAVLVIGGYHGWVHLQPPDDPNHIYHRIPGKSDAVVIGTMSTMAGFDGAR